MQKFTPLPRPTDPLLILLNPALAKTYAANIEKYEDYIVHSMVNDNTAEYVWRLSQFFP